MNREEFIEKVSKLPKFIKNELTNEPIGLEKAKELADLIDTWQDETYESIYNIAMKERNNKGDGVDGEINI